MRLVGHVGGLDKGSWNKNWTVKGNLTNPLTCCTFFHRLFFLSSILLATATSVWPYCALKSSTVAEDSLKWEQKATQQCFNDTLTSLNICLYVPSSLSKHWGFQVKLLHLCFLKINKWWTLQLVEVGGWGPSLKQMLVLTLEFSWKWQNVFILDFFLIVCCFALIISLTLVRYNWAACFCR